MHLMLLYYNPKQVGLHHVRHRLGSHQTHYFLIIGKLGNKIEMLANIVPYVKVISP